VETKNGTEKSGRLATLQGVLSRGIAWVRRHWRLALGAVLLVLLVAGPGYTATQPEFFNRFERLGTYYETWSASTHANVTCQRCHVAPGVVTRSTYNVRMAGEAWLALLPLDREPDVLGDVPSASCNDCHIDLRSISPAGDLLIPHTAHVDALGIECAVCHDAVMVHGGDPEVGSTPQMETCLACHDGERAKDNCDACHTQKALPEDHQDPAWVVVHSQRQSDSDCVSCHGWVEEWCAECHVRRPASHGSASDPSVWRKAHRTVIEVRRNCEACHEGPFCIECHGEVPELNFDPTLTLAR
jgi:hypothetical protein